MWRELSMMFFLASSSVSWSSWRPQVGFANLRKTCHTATYLVTPEGNNSIPHFVAYIKYISWKALRDVSVARVLSRVSWGVSLSLLLSVYRVLVRAYLEWSSPLFQSAGKTGLRILDRVQYETLRATSSWKTCPGETTLWYPDCFRVSSSRCGLMSAYECALRVTVNCFRTIRPSYFDYSWKELTLPISVDFDYGRAITLSFT